MCLNNSLLCIKLGFLAVTLCLDSGILLRFYLLNFLFQCPFALGYNLFLAILHSLDSCIGHFLLYGLHSLGTLILVFVDSLSQLTFSTFYVVLLGCILLSLSSRFLLGILGGFVHTSLIGCLHTCKHSCACCLLCLCGQDFYMQFSFTFEICQ